MKHVKRKTKREIEIEQISARLKEQGYHTITAKEAIVLGFEDREDAVEEFTDCGFMEREY